MMPFTVCVRVRWAWCVGKCLGQKHRSDAHKSDHGDRFEHNIESIPRWTIPYITSSRTKRGTRVLRLPNNVRARCFEKRSKTRHDWIVY